MRIAIMMLGFLGTSAILIGVGVVIFALSDASTVTAGSLSSTTRQILKTEVSVADVPVSLKSGDTQIIGFRIENPPGFSEATAIHFPYVTASTDAFRSGPRRIFINKLFIKQPEIRLEIRDGQANLTRYMQAANAAQQSTKDGIDEMKFSIGEILIEDGGVTFVADSLGDEPVRTPLPDSRLTNIGLTGDGITADRLATQVIDFIRKSTERASRRIDLAKIAEQRGLPAPNLDLKTLLSE